MNKLMQEELTKSFEEMGLSKSTAKIAARGREGIDLEVNDENFEEILTETFKEMGLSESTAKIAARGRN